MKQGYLLLRVIGILLMTIAGFLIAYDLAVNYGDAIREALPYGYYLFAVSLVIIGIFFEIYAKKREGTIIKQSKTGYKR